jgi:hypothetical protein
MAIKFKRARLLVDAAFQARLLARMGLYLFLYAVVVWHLGFLYEVLLSSARTGFPRPISAVYVEYLQAQTPLLYAFLMMTPILLYDLLKFSNRIAGPLFRCRRMMQKMADGKLVEEFIPRKNDFLSEFFQSFNALIATCNARVQMSKDASPGVAGTLPSEPLGEGAPPRSPSAEAQRLNIQPTGEARG